MWMLQHLCSLLFLTLCCSCDGVMQPLSFSFKQHSCRTVGVYPSTDCIVCPVGYHHEGRPAASMLGACGGMPLLCLPGLLSSVATAE